MYRKIGTVRNWLLALLACFACSCNNDRLETPETDGTTYTYPMRFEGGCATFDGETSTRAPYVWADGDVIYLHFQVGSKQVRGEALYDFDTDLWTVTATEPLASDSEGVCTSVFIHNPSSVSGTKVQLSQQSVVYRDEQSAYSVQDGELTVTGLLLPQTGRIQLRGDANTSFTLSGLSFLTAYDTAGDSFTQAPSKFTATTQADGRTPYYYATFAEEAKRELTFTLNSSVALRRTFGTAVLSIGKSGYITIPTMESHEGWTLIDPSSSAELSLPSLSTVTSTSVRSKSAKFSATVTHTGNTALTATGFVLSRYANPTLSDTHVACTTATAFSGSISNLLPQTKYYVRAYATNALGTTYSAQLSFTTLSEEEDKGSVGRDDFEPDVDLNDVQQTGADVGHEVFGEDEDWN